VVLDCFLFYVLRTKMYVANLMAMVFMLGRVLNKCMF